MPHRRYRFPCHLGFASAQNVCPECGRPGENDGWSYSIIERWLAFQEFYCIKPLSPQTALVYKLLEPLSAACPLCDGRGVVDAAWRDDYALCAICRGSRRIRISSDEEFESARQRVIDAFPGTGGYPLRAEDIEHFDG